MNEVHGRYGEAGGHMKYSHIECFRTRPIEAEGG